MLRQNGKRFYKGLYVIFKLTPGLKKNTELEPFDWGSR